MMKIKSIISCLFVIVLLVVLPGLALGKRESLMNQNIKSLRGIKCVAVAVERLEPEIEKVGLSKDLMRRDVERKLRLSGIKVLTQDEPLKRDCGFLYLNANIARTHDGGYNYSVNLEFMQGVYIVRNDQFMLAKTWGRGGVGITQNVTLIRKQVKDHADEFLYDWRSVNPK